MYEIDIADQQECLTIDEAYIARVVRATLQAEQVRSASISIAIVDNPTIHELNRDYLQHDYETDVLSFLLDDGPPEMSDDELESDGGSVADSFRQKPRGAGRHIDGEVIVSAEYAAQQAQDFDWPAMHELTLYIVHGLLHLCGYDDLTVEELPHMRRRECDVFEALGLPQPVRDQDDYGHAAAPGSGEDDA